eukprot:SAG11_NODE_36583_length_260_cov_15.881988_1_plen_86_part_11
MIAEVLIETVVSDDPWNYDLHPTAKDLKQCFVNLASKCNVHILDKVYVGLVSSWVHQSVAMILRFLTLFFTPMETTVSLGASPAAE